MKTRLDFVSNSSSCSFIVDDGKAALRVFKTIAKKNIPLCIDGTGFRLFGSKEDLEKISAELELGRDPSNCYDGSYELYDLSFSTVLALNPRNMKNISIGVSAEVYDEAQALFVRLLNRLLQNNNVKVESTGDYSIELDNEDIFLAYLWKKAMNGDRK